jgi:TRAP-type mannitol/chloroaromatic compound transport system permease small subunit
MKRIAGWIDWTNEYIGRAMAWLMIVLTLIVAFNALFRWWFDFGNPMVDETTWWLFSIIFLMAAGYTYLYNDHVRVDIVYSLIPKRWQAWVDVVCSFIFLFPFSLLVILTSRRFIIASWEFKESSPDPGGLPAWYILKVFIPLGFLFLLLQGVAEIFKKIRVIRTQEGK